MASSDVPGRPPIPQLKEGVDAYENFEDDMKLYWLSFKEDDRPLLAPRIIAMMTGETKRACKKIKPE